MEETFPKYSPELHFLGESLQIDEYDFLELFPEIPIKEELVEEVMQELYREITCNNSEPTNQIELETFPAPFPYLSASFVVGNDKSAESCGASVSDLESTVMAGIEFFGPTVVFDGRNVASSEIGNAEEVVVVEEMNGYDGEEVNDEWLARIMSWPTIEIDPWF